MYGDDWDYASSRLVGTIVRIGNIPVFVHEIGPGMLTNVSKLSSVYNTYNVHISELNLVPVPLGMCNFRGVTGYLSRIPMRRDWKQGLRAGNFCSFNGLDASAVPPDVLGATIEGIYPTFKEALVSVSTKAAKEVAWCREWAITDKMSLLYKMDGKVGSFKNGVPTLDSRYQYLREALQEAM